MKKLLLGLFACLFISPLSAQENFKTMVDQMADEIEDQVIQWRRYIHQNPELSNREFETGKYIAKQLGAMGIEVQTNVAKTGVVGLLKGGKKGPVIGLRADIDALPVKERVDVPFASKAKGVYQGNEVDVMHACGHDTHVAMLLGAAKILSDNRKQLHGTVKFIFQPAEEGPPVGEEGGASLMVKEGVLKNPDVDVIFGQHISSKVPVGVITYRPRGTMAAAESYKVEVKGKQTHGSTPWTGADPIMAASLIVQGFQTIISRQTDLTKAAAVISVGAIHGGVRNNIIPEEVIMEGTIRTLDRDMQKIIHEKMHHIVKTMASTQGCEGILTINRGTPVTFNDPDLTKQMLPSLQEAAGMKQVVLVPPITGAEDFSVYQKEVPGLFFFTGGMPLGTAIQDAAPHHTPDFFIDESGMKLGVRALCYLTWDYMMSAGK